MNKQDLRTELNVKQRDFDVCCKRLGITDEELSQTQENQLRKLIGYCADGMEFDAAVRMVVGQEFTLVERYNVSDAAEKIATQLIEAIDDQVIARFESKLKNVPAQKFNDFISGFTL